jgi:hypothetical protein
MSVAQTVANPNHIQNYQGVLPMTTINNNTNNSVVAKNNSQIFSDYAALVASQSVAAQGLDKPVLGSFTIPNLDKPVVVRERSVIINDSNVTGFILSGEAECRGAMTALIDGFHIAKYAVLEMGLHLFKTEAELAGLPVAQSVGYLTASYAGSNAHLQSIKPTAGVAVLNWFGGNFKVASVVASAPQARYDESDFVTKARRIFYKHTLMDAILAGAKICVFPNLLNKVETTPGTFAWKRNIEREVAFLNGYTKNLFMSPEQAVLASRQAAYIGNMKRTMGKIDQAVNEGRIEMAETVFVGKVEFDIKYLIGKRLSKMKGNIRLMDVNVTPSNARVIATEARDLGLTFIVVPQ